MRSTELKLKMKMTTVALGLALAVTASAAAFAQAPAPAPVPAAVVQTPDAANYIISTGDELQIFVWKNPELSTTAPVRPDGKITAPLVQDIQAQGKTPTQLSADLAAALATYVREPTVTVVVRTFAAASNNEAAIRVIGSALAPKTVPYRKGITALDVMIALGGLPTYASGNKAEMLRTENGVSRTYPLRLNDLMKKGNLKANVTLMPGDVIRIPERFF